MQLQNLYKKLLENRDSTIYYSLQLKSKWDNIGLSGKFVPMLKENLNAENLNFNIHLLNYIG